MMELLEGEGLAAEMEKVPPRRAEEKAPPAVEPLRPRGGAAEGGRSFLRRDWAELLEDPEAAAAAERGRKGVDLDAGGRDRLPGLRPPLRGDAGAGRVPGLRALPGRARRGRCRTRASADGPAG